MVLSPEIRPDSCANRVTARYIAPESRYWKENFFATSFAKLLLPVDEQPSTAMIMSGILIYSNLNRLGPDRGFMLVKGTLYGD